MAGVLDSEFFSPGRQHNEALSWEASGLPLSIYLLAQASTGPSVQHGLASPSEPGAGKAVEIELD